MIIDGKSIAAQIRAEVAAGAAALARSARAPGLAVVLCGDNPASVSYVTAKERACAECGIASFPVRFPAGVSREELLAEIRRLNAADEVDGILVQLPLPKQIDEERVIDAIDKSKDVDGFHVLNVGDLWLGRPCSVPCTPKGILRLIDESGIDLCGKTAVVVGRSNIVGKPVAKLLLDRNATVIVAHSRTKDLKSVTLQADVLVVAVGRENVVTGDMVKPGAVVIDVGMNRNAEGKLCGDVDFVGARQRASWITPVPGGVGPMTIAMLMENTVECFLARVEKA